MNHLPITNDKHQLGIGKLGDEAPPFEVHPFDAVFDREWTSDVHFACYGLFEEGGVSKELYPRIRKSALTSIRDNGGDVVVGALTLDFDLKDLPDQTTFTIDDEGKPIWSTEELRSFTGALPIIDEALAAKGIAPPLVYTTTHGARFVHKLLRPVVCERAEDLLRGLHKVYGEIGIPLDPLSDWTRLFRAPKVVRGKSKTWTERWFFLRTVAGTTDADAIDPVTKAETYKDRYENITPIDSSKPSPEVAHDLLFTDGAKGAQKPSVMRKAAEVALRTTQVYRVLFENIPIAEEGSRDQTLIKLVGSATNHLLGTRGVSTGVEFSPEDIYSLFLPAVEQLAPDPGTPDWTESLWTKVCSVYAKERAKVASQQVQAAVAEDQNRDKLHHMLDVVRQNCALPALHDDDEVSACNVLSRMLLLCDSGGKFRAIMPDGSISRLAVSPTRIHSLIRSSGIEDLIPLSKPGAKGGFIVRSEIEIAREHSVDIQSVEGASGIDRSFVFGDDIQDLRIRLALYRRNPRLEPEFNEDVAKWLDKLTDEPGLLKRWLAYALDFEGGPICALSLAGAAGAGKGMLAQGLVETLENPMRADKTALVGEFNGTLALTPWLIVDEGLPRNTAHDIADTFRQLTAGEPITVNEKYKTPVCIRNSMRILFTANNLDVIEQLTSHRVTDAQDQAALSVRIMHIDVPQDAERHLRSRGGLKHTRGWVEGANGSPSQYTLAKHLLWLYESRAQYGEPAARFLVEGRPDHSVVQTLRVAGRVPQAIARAILTALEHGVVPSVQQGLSIQDGRLWITSRAIEEQHRQLNESNIHLNSIAIGRALRNMVSPTSTSAIARVTSRETIAGTVEKQRWWDIDVNLMWSYAVDAGYPRQKLAGLMQAQHGPESIE